MSECVVRMEMPQDGVCDGCDARTVDFLAGPICAIKKKFLGSSRPSWCPIICSLPEGHGRLVDADALADDVRSLWDYKTVDGITATTVLNQTLTDIRNCPTIVPAERSDT